MNLTLFITTITVTVIVGCSAFIGGRVPSSRGSASSSASGSRGGSRSSYGSHGGSSGSSRGSSGSGSTSGSSRGSSASTNRHGSHGSSSGSSRGSSISGSSNTYSMSSPYSGGTGGSQTYSSSKGSFGTGSASTSRGYYAPSYYSSLQHIYVTKYKLLKQSNSGRYNDILIGLALYDVVRSHTHHTYYYHDSYYRRSTISSGKAVDDLNKDDATCFLKMRTMHDEVVKVPCAIVSTFSTGIYIPSNLNLNNGSLSRKCTSDDQILFIQFDELFFLNNYNSISCANGVLIVEDPLSVKGEPIDTTNMECIVAILTERGVIQNNLDCEILLKYAKMPVPEKKVTGVLPRRETLKAWLEKPPWWLSFFIAAF